MVIKILDRWIEINLEFINPKIMDDNFKKFIKRSKSFFNSENKGVSLIVEFHGDDICLWSGNLNNSLPATMAKNWKYEDLKRLISFFHDYGFKIAHSVQANWYEYVPGTFALKHRELGVGFGIFYNLFAKLKKDNYKYAAYPNGIPEGIEFYKFFIEQWKDFSSLMEFDYIFLRDGWLGKSWKRDSYIEYTHDERYERMFDEFSRVTKVITWNTGMTCHPFHTGIDLRKIMKYVDIFITQSYSNAWNTHWIKFNKTAIYGGHTAQIAYAMVNQMLSKQYSSKTKHYVLLDAIDWEGWNGIHVNKDRARGMLWHLLLSAYEKKEFKFPDGIWIGQAFDHKGTPLFTQDFDWLNYELEKVEQSKPNQLYGLKWKFNIENIERIGKLGIGYDPDGLQDEISILLKWSIPISLIINNKEDSSKYIAWNEDADIIYGDANFFYENIIEDNNKLNNQIKENIIKCSGIAKIFYNNEEIGKLSLSGSMIKGDSSLMADLTDDKIHKFCKLFTSIKLDMEPQFKQSGIYIPVPVWLMEKILKKYSFSGIPLKLLKIFGWIYFPLSNKLGNLFGFKFRPTKYDYIAWSNIKLGETTKIKNKIKPQEVKVPLIMNLKNKIIAKPIYLRDIPYKKGNFLVESCIAHKYYSNEIKKFIDDIYINSEYPLTIKAFQSNKICIIVSSFDIFDLDKTIEFFIKIKGNPKRWGYFNENFIMIKDLIEGGNSRIYEIELDKEDNTKFPHIIHSDSPLNSCEIIQNSNGNNLICEVYKKGGILKIAIKEMSEIYATENVEYKFKNDTIIIKIPQGKGTLGLFIGKLEKNSLINLEHLKEFTIGTNIRKLAKKLKINYTTNPINYDIIIWKGNLNKKPKIGALILHGSYDKIEYIKKELDDCVCDLSHKVLNFPRLVCLTHQASGYFDIKNLQNGNKKIEIIGYNKSIGNNNLPTFLKVGNIYLTTNYIDKFYTKDYKFHGLNYKIFKNIVYWISRKIEQNPIKIL